MKFEEFIDVLKEIKVNKDGKDLYLKFDLASSNGLNKLIADIKSRPKRTDVSKIKDFLYDLSSNDSLIQEMTGNDSALESNLKSFINDNLEYFNVLSRLENFIFNGFQVRFDSNLQFANYRKIQDKVQKQNSIDDKMALLLEAIKNDKELVFEVTYGMEELIGQVEEEISDILKERTSVIKQKVAELEIIRRANLNRIKLKAELQKYLNDFLATDILKYKKERENVTNFIGKISSNITSEKEAEHYFEELVNFFELSENDGSFISILPYQVGAFLDSVKDFIYFFNGVHGESWEKLRLNFLKKNLDELPECLSLCKKEISNTINDIFSSSNVDSKDKYQMIRTALMIKKEELKNNSIKIDNRKSLICAFWKNPAPDRNLEISKALQVFDKMLLLFKDEAKAEFTINRGLLT